MDNWLNEELQCPCCGRNYAGDEDLAAGDRCPAVDECLGYGEDWYAKRHEMMPGMVFQTYDDCIVKLDRGVAGDATKWFVLSGYQSHNTGKWAWSCDDSTIEPGDLTKRLPDDYAGEAL